MLRLPKRKGFAATLKMTFAASFAVAASLAGPASVPVITNYDHKEVNPSATQTLNWIPQTVTGDLLLIFTQCPGNVNVTTPTGFTLLQSIATGATATDCKLISYYKLATASEPANYPVTFSASGQTSAILLLVQGGGASPVGPVATRANTGVSTIFNSIATTTKNSLIIAVEAIESATASSWGITPGFTNWVNSFQTSAGLTVDILSGPNPGTFGPYTGAWTGAGAGDKSCTQLIAVI